MNLRKILNLRKLWKEYLTDHDLRESDLPFSVWKETEHAHSLWANQRD